jgi:hypothetical protein
MAARTRGSSEVIPGINWDIHPEHRHKGDPAEKSGAAAIWEHKLQVHEIPRSPGPPRLLVNGRGRGKY